MKDYKEAKKRADVSIGESVKIIRELQELSQNKLSLMTGIHNQHFQRLSTIKLT